MAKISKFTLDNGLRVILFPNPRTPFIATHLLFKAGSKYEQRLGSGLAHLLEHLMFSGTKAVPHYDQLLQKAGASNNAYTSKDLSAYFTEVPYENIDTILFVESDRMRNLCLNKEAFLTQKKVVIEEFKENYLTRPYGDLWHLIGELSHRVHPYRYPVIGKDINLVDQIRLAELREFYHHYYQPQHTILAMAGNFRTSSMRKKINQYFGKIAKNNSQLPQIPLDSEFYQTENTRTVYRSVPANRLIKAYKFGGRANNFYYPATMLSEILGDGNSALLKEELVEKQALCTKCNAGILSLEDASLLIIDMTLKDKVNYSQVEQALETILTKLKTHKVTHKTLQKVKNNIYAAFITQDLELGDVAEDLAYYSFLNLDYSPNSEQKKYNSLSTQNIQDCAQKLLRKNNSITLEYRCKN